MLMACSRLSFLLALFGALGLINQAHAQWLTQTFDLKGGWNAVYVHVDSSHATLTELIGEDAENPIQEVWVWDASPSLGQFVTNPQQPVSDGTQWRVWERAKGDASALQRLGANVACLVRVASETTDYTWNLKGEPAPPQYQWTTTGLNFLGFATPTHTASAPSVDDFMEKAPDLGTGIEIYRYPGGELGAGNPSRVFALWTTPLRRGEAFWVRAGTEFNRYFGTFEVDLQNPSGVHFQKTGGQFRIRLRNATLSELTITMNVIASEAAPTGQTPIAETPPLLLRGALDMENFSYAYTSLNAGPQQWTLAPKGETGSSIELIVGVNRAVMTGDPAELYACILRLEDSLDLTRIDLPVSASPAPSEGLWVGDAMVNQVRHYLKNYQRNTDGTPAQTDSGQYIVASTDTSFGSVPRPFNLRVILHKSATETRLFQRLFYGIGLGSTEILTTREDFLDPDRLESARRISAVHLPFSDANAGWAFTGEFAQGESMVAQVNLPYSNHAANPFLHSFHPDHDNLNARFDAIESRGTESYDIERKLTLTFTPANDDFVSLVSGGNQMAGEYAEEIVLKGRGGESRQIDTAGSFVIRRISGISTVTTE